MSLRYSKYTSMCGLCLFYCHFNYKLPTIKQTKFWLFNILANSPLHINISHIPRTTHNSVILSFRRLRHPLPTRPPSRQPNPFHALIAMSNTNQPSSGLRKSTTTGTTRSGVTLMKTVSVMLASARRSSNALQQRRIAEEANKTAPKKNRRRNNMEDRAAKMSPKLLESLAKRTHFNKWLFLIDLKIIVKLYIHFKQKRVGRHLSNLSQTSSAFQS